MRFVRKIRQRLLAMNQLKDAGLAAEEIASEMGDTLVGAEHWLLAAFCMPDGTAPLVFERVDSNCEALKSAIRTQYEEALADAGILVPDTNFAAGDLKKKGLVQSQASCNALFAAMTSRNEFYASSVFLGAEIVRGAAQLERGTVPRALSIMRIKRAELRAEAEQVIAMYAKGRQAI